jgi:threonine/homoserine/homoserine lactone efflux protein
MLLYLAEGVLLGITVAFIIGPVFFTILQTSIYRGFRAGVFLSFGVMLSDLTLIVLSYIGLLELINNDANQIVIGIAGGILLIGFGVVTIRRRPVVKVTVGEAQMRVSRPGAITYIVKGYFMNIMNPFLLVFWVTVMSVFGAREDVELPHILIFFTGTLVTIFITDVIKCYIAKKIKKFITARTLLYINRFVGATLVGFGIYLIAKVMMIQNGFY